jgi:lysophospholipase L1-like esterase
MARKRLPAANAAHAAVAALALAVLALHPGTSRAGANRTSFRFDFGPGKVEPGYTKVLPATVYTRERGYGFDLGSKVTGVDRGGADALRGDFCTGDKPFFFSVDLPEGNYNVSVTLGDLAGAADATVRAESRRLMRERVRTAPGEFAKRTFTVNVRNRRIAPGGEVRLKAREQGALHWDDRLTLEFSGPRPCVCGLQITRADGAITVYLAGDSTVTDQTRPPWGGWGQMLPRFFKPGGVAVANHAESGESLRSFVAEKRLEKVLSTIKAGDYLLIQFGHNDQKEKGADVGPFTSYQRHLRRFIAEARKRGATPVLVTPMHRRRFDAGGKVVNTLGDYPEAMRQTAREEKVALIDLNAMSKDFYEALGPEASKKAFVDNTHTNEYGAYELARCVAEGIQKSKLGLARHVVDDLPPRNTRPETFDLGVKSR